MKRKGLQFATILLSSMPLAAFAHTGHGESGLLAGLLHPITGLDHFLALLAIGIWAVLLKNGGRKNAALQVPVAFLLALLFGASMALWGASIPMVETGIATSVLLLGLLLVAGKSLPLLATLPITVSFALVHGFAHGTEMPLSVNIAAYLFGFLLSSAMLILCGSVFATVMLKAKQTKAVVPISGGAIALSGMMLLVV
ncbi:HupE/UreJ family protein [Enterovibrio sp. ZSDZ35]|uniref:HupE/UreJ family protein n=1 Tax=Enterovibrio qingdaonensis TaxID=2899818 RepID=A0ABT5QI85_9GAMM|nr:HupE/UreJ family protein [Enterovibrio sp. ZSDZ35]MDD1780701.1 HupE/UreJ family protein [Enterovibrio sp. ZSDZ35]